MSATCRKAEARMSGSYRRTSSPRASVLPLLAKSESRTWSSIDYDYTFGLPKVGIFFDKWNTRITLKSEFQSMGLFDAAEGTRIHAGRVDGGDRHHRHAGFDSF